MNPVRAIKLLVCGVAACFALAVHQFGVTPSSDQAHWGEFGEYIGGLLGPVFSLLAFFGVLWTLQLQRVALLDSRQQQAERTFFELLANLRASSEQMIYRKQFTQGAPELTEAIPVSEALRAAWRSIKKLLNSRMEKTPEGARKHVLEVIDRALHSEYNDATRFLNKLFLVYLYIYKAKLPHDLKELYVRLLNDDVASECLTMLLMTALEHSKDSPQVKMLNELGAFRNLNMPAGMQEGAPAYFALVREYFPNLPKPRAETLLGD